MGLSEISQETLDQVYKASTSGFLSTTGLYGYDLSQWVSLIPVETPFRNSLSRQASPDGNKFAVWRALLNVNASQADPAIGFDFAGNLVIVNEQDQQAPYQPLAVAGRVTRDSIRLAQGYADAQAIETVNVLNQLMIAEDWKLIGAQNFALATPGTPTVTQSDTGGSIAASTAVNVKVAARTGNNYAYGGSGIASAQGTVTTSTVAAATHSATATVAAVKGAVAYDWFVAGFYFTTTIVNSVTITSIPTANQALPSSLPLLSTVAPIAVPTGDNTGKPNDFNGLLATTLGDYSANGTLVTPGTGTGSGAYWQSLDAGTLTLQGGTIKELDALFLGIWNTSLLSPTALMMNAQQAQDIGNKVLSQPSAVTYLEPDDATGRTDAIAGGFVGSVVNKPAGGVRVPVEVHPHLPPGTIFARTDRVPFPGSNIGQVFNVRTLEDYSRFDYAANYNPGVAGGGPRSDFEVRCIQTLINRAPVVQGVISNISAG